MKLTPAISKTPLNRAEKHSRAPASFPIVGLGASAGGLEAFRQLLQNLPTDTGMAFVLVQHLDPDHPSALTQLLARCTAMPVSEVENGSRVEPNHVYVIAPNTSMIIAKGILKLEPRSPGVAGIRPINVFFESLAHDERERAIGVVLSGTASDGTLGLEAIKAEGGITFAQDESAKHDSMPRSAVAAGCVDLILSPEKIAEELARIARHPSIAIGMSAGAGSENRSDDGDESSARFSEAGNGFTKILHLLRNHSGVDFSSYKFRTIHRRLNRRLVLNKLLTVDDYVTFLRNNPTELEALFSDVLINVTSFFRNPEAFEVLKSKVFPALLRDRKEGPIRVWVAACSTGQEAYSIAMSYLEFADQNPRAPGIQVFATDLHDRILDKARNGLYAENMVEDVSPKRLRRFFTKEDGGWRVAKQLRDTVVFARQNALSDPPFSRIDLISCRNMLIYLESSLQKKILPAFHYALTLKGFLFLGASESVNAFPELFEPIEKKHRIFVKKPAPTPPLHLEFAPRHPAGKIRLAIPKPAGALLKMSDETNIQREADRVALFRYAAPSVVVNAEWHILQFRGDSSPYLKPPPGKATFHLLKMAKEGLMVPLRAALNKARKENKVIRSENISVPRGGQGMVTLEVIPLKNLNGRHYLIFFEPVGTGGKTRSKSRDRKRLGPDSGGGNGKEANPGMAVLERELAEARDYLQSVQEQYDAGNEELQASNEEIISANEELQSVNEELETAKEELEASNEELTTVNEEMSHRNLELVQLNSDLVNFQNSADLAILLIGRNLAIRRFTPQAAQQFNLLAVDVGRPINGLRHNLDIPDLEEVIQQVMDTSKEARREVRDKGGHWYLLRVVPYLGPGKEVEGAVLVIVDIDAIKRTALEIAEHREYAESIVRSAPVAFIVLEPDFRIHFANDAFYRAFKVTPEQTEGHSIFELGDGRWNMPKLREMLAQIIPQNSFFDDFEVIHENNGKRAMLLNARILQSSGTQPKRILLGILDITGRREDEKAQKVLAAIVECSSDAILSKNLNGNILSWNQGAERLFGYTANEIIGKPIYVLVPEQNRSDETEILEKIAKGERVYHYETARLCKDGSVVEVSLSASPIRDASDRIIGASTIARDISERKKADAALRKSEERFRALMSASSDMMYCMSPDWSEMRQLQGRNFLPDTEKPSRHWLQEYIHPDDQPHVKAVIEEAIQTKSVFELEHRVLRVDGTIGWTFSRAVPLLDEKGNIVEWFGAASDVTARKSAEEALRENRMRDDFIKDAAQIGFWFCDLPFDVLNWDAVVKDHFWLPPDAHVTIETFYQCLHPDDRDRTRQAIADSIANHNRYEIEYRTISPDGREKWIRAIGRTFYDAADRPCRFDGLTLDVTEQRRAENALNEAHALLADKAKHLETLVQQRTATLRDTIGELEAFSYTISHDMRGPLRWMQNFALILTDSYASQLDEQGKDCLRRITSSAERMDRLIRDVLSYSQVVKTNLPLVPIDFKNLLQDILASYPMFQPPAAVIEFADSFPSVLGVQALLTQCISNLLGNAVKFVPPGITPHVRVFAESSEKDGFVRICFKDNGIGIAPEDQKKIFGIFERLGKDYDGTGIGLAIVKKGAEQMEGSVGLESDLGKGSQFWLELRQSK